MGDRQLRILLVEDVLTDAELEVRELRRAGLRVSHHIVETEEAFRAALREFDPELIISDFSMPHFDGMWALELSRELAPEVPFIFVSGTIGEEYAIRALRNGATDYVLKSNLVRLPAAVERALQDNAERTARRIAEARHRATFDNAPIGIMHTDIDTDRILLANPRLVELLGYTQDELLAMTTNDILHPDQRGTGRGKYRERILKGELNSFASERQFVRKDGSAIWVNRTMSLVRDAAGKPLYFIRMVEDIAGRKSQELKIARLSRIQAVLSGINSTIVRVRDRQELFNEACRIAVEHGNFGIAWIGLLNPANLDIIPAACAGVEAGSLIARSHNTARADSALGYGFVGRAIREKRMTFSNDISLEGMGGGERRKEALRRGYRSLIVVPLLVDGTAVGILSLFAKEPDFFDDEEIKLLSELARDISFALEHITKEEKLAKLSRIRMVSSEINSMIVRARDRQELLNEACRIAVEQAGFPLAWIGMLDPASQDLKAAAMAGSVLEYGKLLKPSVRGDTPAGQGTNGRAFRERKTIVDNDTATNLDVGFMRDEGLRHGIRAALSLPLLVQGASVGVMGLYAKEKDYFDDEEVKLLNELAGNVSFALAHIAREEKLAKVSRIRMVSSEINAAIVRIHDREALLRETCRIAAEHGKFDLVWIGTLDQDRQEIRPVAWKGFSTETAHAVSWASIAAAKGTLGEAVASRSASVRNDIEAELPGGKLRQEALERGCRSTICLPLVADDRVVALVVLFAAGQGFFDKDELTLLNELAADVSLALQSISRQERLSYLAYYDVLTGLPNRTLFLEHVSHALRAAEHASGQLVLVMGDIKRFRMINDTLGRQAGDEVLKQVTARLLHRIQNPENLARVSADYFATFLADVKDLAEVSHRIENLVLEALRDPIAVGDRELNLSFTIGVSVYPHDGTDAETLFRNAEAALKKAKASGERYLFYQPQMNAKVAETLLLETKLRRALEKEQFVLHYQPKIELASGRVSGLEALIRWNDPATGLVPPANFIPILEETGMISEVGLWALRRALVDYRTWYGDGLRSPRVAVNVSPIQLARKDFVDVIRVVIREAGAPAEGLDLEITESLLMADIESNIAKLRAVRDMGVQIAIDDFGTGYSSLGYLARLPVNALKIDRSFVVTMVSDADSMSIVSTIISLAHTLNLKVIAEGVDSEEQSRFLRLLKCDEIQGYLISRPVPASEIEPLLAARRNGAAR